ncbi:MAG: hypothetical protein Q8M31_18420 [Beijerinckiaceae bacterium]|nr:hypothetical protein [Beijerinckiaceae bacterium]
MGYFPETIAAALAGSTVRPGYLVHLDFLDDPQRLWLGHGLLEAGGHTWSGIGELASISGIESAIGGTAPVVTFGLSGVSPAIIAASLVSASQAKGRDAAIYLQFFDEAGQTLDNPYAVWLGFMDVMRVQVDGPQIRRVELTAETLFTRRASPPWGYLSDRDQQRLFPGDRGLEEIAAMRDKSVEWPVF